jgi:pimeloyl-ACP methyl ester carboxylesterase
MLADFAGVLDGLHQPAPYILVGHSYGALLARLYAELHPQQVEGLVLLDPVLACDWAKPVGGQKRVLQTGCVMAAWGGFLTRFGVVRFATGPLLRGSTLVPKLVAKASAGPAAGVLDRLVGEIRKLPPATWPIVRAHWCRASNFRALAKHLRALPSTFDGLRNFRFDFPLVVVSAANLSNEGLAEHRAIAGLSSRGEHIRLTRGGHWVQFEDPDLIADAIRRVVAAKGTG